MGKQWNERTNTIGKWFIQVTHLTFWSYVFGYCGCCCCYLTMILTLKVTLRFFLCLVFRVRFTVPSKSFALFFTEHWSVYLIYSDTENRSKTKTMFACAYALHNCCSCNNESAVIFVCYLNVAHRVGVIIKIKLMTLACEDGAVIIRTHFVVNATRLLRAIDQLLFTYHYLWLVSPQSWFLTRMVFSRK